MIKKLNEEDSIKRLNSVTCATNIICNKRSNQYQEPINKLAYKVVDKVKHLRRKGFSNESKK